MAKSFGYIPLHPVQVFKDHYWLKYKLQVEAYFALCHKNPEWFKENNLPLPEACNLFSYALDNGVVYRTFTWVPDNLDKVLSFARRWNRAYASETMPECTCDTDARKFCYYAQEQDTTKTGAKIGTKCCGEDLDD